MKMIPGSVEVTAVVDFKFEGMTDTEVSDLISIINTGIETLRKGMSALDGAALEARKRLIATGGAVRKELDRLEDVIESYTNERG